MEQLETFLGYRMNKDKDSLTADLLALAQVAPADPMRTKAARLRAVLPAVEAALAAGTSREKVLETLRAHGLDMTLAVFNTTLRRLRAAQTNAGKKIVPQMAAAPKATATATQDPHVENPSEPIPSLHDLSKPVDLNRLINAGKEGRKK